MKKIVMSTISLLILAPSAIAHPHDNIEQQALLSIGLDRARLEVRIVPSFDEGAEIFLHLDSDMDGSISTEEASAFGKTLIDNSELSINGRRETFKSLSVSIPDRSQITSGLGQITISAVAKFPKLRLEKQFIEFEIAFEQLTRDWFIQPFFFPDLHEAMSMEELTRSQEGRKVELRFRGMARPLTRGPL